MLVKIGKYTAFYLYPRSYLLWSSVRVEQQSIKLINRARRQRLRWCSKLSSKQQHSVQVRIARKLRWHETSAETPNKCQLRDGTRAAAEADGSVFH